jgi:hypothetical protein
MAYFGVTLSWNDCLGTLSFDLIAYDLTVIYPLSAIIDLSTGNIKCDGRSVSIYCHVNTASTFSDCLILATRCACTVLVSFDVATLNENPLHVWLNYQSLKYIEPFSAGRPGQTRR